MSRNASRKPLQVVTPRRATRKELAVYHTEDYLDTVLTPMDDVSISMAVDADFGLEDVSGFGNMGGSDSQSTRSFDL